MSFRLMSRLLAAASAALLVAGVPAASAAASPGWAQPGYGPGHTFYNPSESVINAASLSKLKQRWATKLPAIEDYSCSRPATPLAVGGRVFVSDETGIGAYQAGTGKKLWHHTFSNPEDETTPHLAVAGNLLVAGNSDCQSQSDPNGGIVALDVVTGKQKWAVGASGPVASMVVDQGMVMVAGSSSSTEPAVRAFRLSDGKKRWTAAGYESAGVSAAGRLLVSRDPGVAALSVGTGKRLWSKPNAWTVVAATPAGDVFYVADAKGGLSALTAATGAVRWSSKVSGGLVAADGKRVFRTVFHGLEALDAKTGKRSWLAYLGQPVDQPVRAGGLLYAGVGDGSIAVLNAATGKRSYFEAGPFNPGGSSHVVLADGRLYQVAEGLLRAYAP